MSSRLGSLYNFLGRDRESGRLKPTVGKIRKSKNKLHGSKSPTVLQYSKRVFAACSVNGISHICLAKTTRRRVLWTLLFMFSFLGWFYQMSALLEYYYRYPTVVKIEVEKNIIVNFPAITICNLNKIRKSEYCKIYPEVCTANTPISLSENDIHNLSLAFFKRNEKRKLGHQLQDLVVKCEFTGEPYLDTEECLKYFTPFYDPKLGNCYVLQSSGDENKRLRVAEPDVWQDLKDMILVLNTEYDEYLNAEYGSPGLIITVHEDMTYPDVFASGLHVYADHTYNLAVEKVTVELLPSPFKSNCTNFEKLPFHKPERLTLTPRMCTVECVIYLQQTKCKHHFVSDDVVLYSKTLPYDPADVTPEDKVCAKQLSESSRDYCGSICSVPCLEQTFSVSVDASPTSEHKVALREKDISSWRNRTQKNNSIYPVDIRVHYKTMEHKIFKHTPEFNTETLFSYLGGITGGWLGISLLEFFAFMEGLFSITTFTLSRFLVRKPRKKLHRKFVKVGSSDQRRDGSSARSDFKNAGRKLDLHLGYH